MGPKRVWYFFLIKQHPTFRTLQQEGHWEEKRKAKKEIGVSKKLSKNNSA